jgi:hypothetical protein
MKQWQNIAMKINIEVTEVPNIFQWKNSKNSTCQKSLIDYTMSNGDYFQICHVNEPYINFKGIAYGNRGHTCAINNSAKLVKEKTYEYKNRHCTIHFTQVNKGFNINFDRSCHSPSWCGMHASFKSGFYKK